jgi:hypothetical protein
MGDSMSTIINATTTNGVVIQPDNSGSLVLQTNSGTTALTIDTSQRAAFVAGTAAAPAITTSGDTNTGMWFPSADTIAFSEGGTEAMRLDSSGNVGIGTTSPTATLNISTASSNATLLQEVARLSTTGRSGAGGTASRGTLLSFSDASNFTLTSAVGGIRQNSDADFNGALAFYTSGTGAAQATSVSQLTERMRIDSGGNVLVGTTNSSSTAGGGFKLLPDATFGGNLMSVVGAATSNSFQGYYLYSTGAGAARFYVGYGGTIFATSTSITAISDESLKENVRDLDVGLNEVMALKPRRFDWKEETEIDEKNVAGFIAQEVADVLPELVYDYQYNETETKKALKMGDMLPTLVKAIQEQQTIINDLKARVETLEAK